MNDYLLSFFTVTVDIDEVEKELHGYIVKVRIMNVTVQGLPDTGKSSLIDLAMGEPPNLDRQSTGIAEPPQCFIVVKDDSSENVEWEKLPPPKMLDALCKTIQNRLAQPVNDQLKTESAAQHETGATPTRPTPSSPISASSDNHPQSTLSLAAPSVVPLVPSLAPLALLGQAPLTKSKRDYPKILKDIIKRLPKVTKPTTLSEARLILMSDSGGQPNFLDVFPLFVRNKCLAIYTLKLCERLDATPEIFYRVEDRSIGPLTNTYSYWRLLESLAKSMSHLKAQYAIVGTFLDMKDQCVETIDEKNKYIANNLKAYENVRFNHKVDAAIYPVNTIAKNGSLIREEYRKELRQLIKKADYLSREKNMKLLSFAFYLSLLYSADHSDKDKHDEDKHDEDKQRAILSMEECLDIGRSLGMTDQEIEEAIMLFHDLNLVFHCQPTELDRFVIVKLECIFDLVSCLICEPVRDRFGIKLPVGVQKDFQKTGRLNQEILEEHFRCKFPKPLNAKDCVSLLAELKAIAIIDESKNTFFMPCVLRYASTEDESKISKRHCPWIIRLVSIIEGEKNVVPLPPSFSPTLIVVLLSCKSFITDKDEAQYRNVFTFQFKDRGDVIIIERQLQLEVYYSFSERVDSECFKISTDIREAILETKTQLSIPDTVKIEESFPCSCRPQTEDKPQALHTLCSEEPPCARCSFTKHKCALNPQELRWIVQGMLI